MLNVAPLGTGEGGGQGTEGKQISNTFSVLWSCIFANVKRLLLECTARRMNGLIICWHYTD